MSEKKREFNSNTGSNYTISFSIFNVETFGLDVTSKVYDLVLKKSVLEETNDSSVLNFLVKEVLTFIKQEDSIIYFYCDHGPIVKDVNKRSMSNQEYRNRLFNALFEREKSSVKREGGTFDFRIYNIHIPDAKHGDHFISLIANKANIDDQNHLAQSIISINDK